MLFLKIWGTGIWFVMGALLLAALFQEKDTTIGMIVTRVVFGVGLMAAAVAMWL